MFPAVKTTSGGDLSFFFHIHGYDSISCTGHSGKCGTGTCEKGAVGHLRERQFFKGGKTGSHRIFFSHRYHVLLQLLGCCHDPPATAGAAGVPESRANFGSQRVTAFRVCTLPIALSSPQRYRENQGRGALLLHTSNIYATLNFHTAFTSQISPTELTFPPLPSAASQGVALPGATDNFTQKVSYTRQGALTKGFHQLPCLCRRCK